MAAINVSKYPDELIVPVLFFAFRLTTVIYAFLKPGESGTIK
jgi:hypothetical protein